MCEANSSEAMRCDAMRCDAMRREVKRCDAMRCGAMRSEVGGVRLGPSSNWSGPTIISWTPIRVRKRRGVRWRRAREFER